MKRLLASVAAVAMTVSLTGAAFAQMTADNVDPTNPFGGIQVNVANLSNAKVRAFNETLNDAQKAELLDRCLVVSATANAARYGINEKTFCAAYVSITWSSRTGVGLDALYGGPNPPKTPAP